MIMVCVFELYTHLSMGGVSLLFSTLQCKSLHVHMIDVCICSYRHMHVCMCMCCVCVCVCLGEYGEQVLCT